jgi:hypothetical protein
MQHPAIDCKGHKVSVDDFPDSLAGHVAFRMAFALLTECHTKEQQVEHLVRAASEIVATVQAGDYPRKGTR